MTTSTLPAALEAATADLCAEARAAVERAAAVVDADRFHGAILQLGRAVDQLEQTRADWISHGRPLMLEHVNGALAVHPLVKIMRDLERDVATASRSVMLEPLTVDRRKPGGQVGKPLAPDRRADLAGRARSPEPPRVTVSPRGGTTYCPDGTPAPPVVQLSRRYLEEQGRASSSN
jgi:hypothetical protein